MRVLIVNVHFSPDSFGGATIVAEQTASRLQGLGHEVFVLTTVSPVGRVPDELIRWDYGGVPVLGVAVQSAPEHTIGYSNRGFVRRFEQVIDVVRPDVVHFHSIQYMGVEQVEAAQRRGVPTVVTLHDAWWLCERQFMIRPTNRWCGQTAIDPRVCSTCAVDRVEHEGRQERSKRILNNCSRVLAPSPYWRDLMVASGLDADKVFVNGNGVQHPAQMWQRTAPKGPIRFGYVGGLNAVKGYPQIVAAFEELVRSDYELHVVDSTLNLGRQSISLADFPITGLVRIIPGYTQETMHEFFGGIDVLLFPSQWPESYGLTVREALTRGVWPVVSDLGAVAEAVEDGVNGSLITVDGTHRPLADALAWILDHRDTIRAPRPVPPIPTFDEQSNDLIGHFIDVVLSGGRTP